MSDGAIVAALGVLGVPVVGAAAGAVFNSFTRRREAREAAERATQAAQAQRFGERIGKLESEADFRRGYEEGRRAGREEATKGHER